MYATRAPRRANPRPYQNTCQRTSRSALPNTLACGMRLLFGGGGCTLVVVSEEYVLDAGLLCAQVDHGIASDCLEGRVYVVPDLQMHHVALALDLAHAGKAESGHRHRPPESHLDDVERPSFEGGDVFDGDYAPRSDEADS